MRLHPITRLLLLAAVLMFGGWSVWAIALGKTIYSLDTLASGPPLTIAAGWLDIAGRFMPLLAYALFTLAGAAWIEVLTRILADLKRRNALSMER